MARTRSGLAREQTGLSTRPGLQTCGARALLTLGGGVGATTRPPRVGNHKRAQAVPQELNQEVSPGGGSLC